MKTKKVLTDPALVNHLHGHQKCVTGLSFHPQTKKLLSSSHDHFLLMWTIKDTVRTLKFPGHTDVVSDACFSPNGQLMASSSFDKTVRLWIPTVGGDFAVCRIHTNAVKSVHFSPDSRVLLTASNDKSIKEWSVSRRTVLSTYSGYLNSINSARYSHDAKTIVSASDNTVKLFDTQNHHCIHTFTEMRVPQKAVFHPSDIYVAAAFSSKCIKLYDLRMLKQLQLYQCHEDDVTSVEFHPNGNYLYSSSYDGTMKIIDLLEGRTLYTLEGNMGPLTTVASSSDGDYFATGCSDGQILLWKTNFEEIPCEEDEIESSVPAREKEFNKWVDSDFQEIQKDEFINAEIKSCSDKENRALNANISGIKALNLEEGSVGIKSCHGEDLKSLSKKMDAILQVMHDMQGQLASLQGRCKKLEDIYFNLT